MDNSSIGNATGSQQNVQFAEQHLKVVPSGQVVMFTDRLIIGDPDGIKLRFPADPDQP